MPARKRYDEAGFLLLEVLVAVVLLGLLSVAIMEGIRFAGRASHEADQRALAAGDTSSLDSFLRRTIGQAIPRFAAAAMTDRTISFDGTASTLSLVAPLPEAMGAQLMARQRIFLGQSGKDKAIFLAWRLDLPDADPKRPVPETIERLADHIGKLQFSYFGRAPPVAPAEWHDRWTHQVQLPELVRIHITRDDQKGALWPDLIVETRTTATIACVYDPADIDCHRVR